MKTYLLPVNIEPDEGDYWFAEIPLLPGCALSCHPREHVLESLQDATQVMLEMMMEYGDHLPEDIELYKVVPGNDVTQCPEGVTVSIDG